jgi:hypothetical protein
MIGVMDIQSVVFLFALSAAAGIVVRFMQQPVAHELPQDPSHTCARGSMAMPRLQP